MSELAVEAPADAVTEPVDAPEPEPADPGGIETPEPAPDPVEPDHSAWLQSDAGQEALRQAVQRELEASREPEQPEPEQDPLADFDFLADDAPQRLAQVLDRREGRMLAAIQQSPAIVHAEEQQQTQWVSDQFHQIETDLKTELPENIRSLAVTMAAGSRPPDWHPSAARFDPAQALQTAARDLHTLMKAEREAAVKAYTDGVSEGAGSGHEPSGNGAGAIRTEEVADSPSEVTRRWLERNGLG